MCGTARSDKSGGYIVFIQPAFVLFSRSKGEYRTFYWQLFNSYFDVMQKLLETTVKNARI